MERKLKIILVLLIICLSFVALYLYGMSLKYEEDYPDPSSYNSEESVQTFLKLQDAILKKDKVLISQLASSEIQQDIAEEGSFYYYHKDSVIYKLERFEDTLHIIITSNGSAAVQKIGGLWKVIGQRCHGESECLIKRQQYYDNNIPKRSFIGKLSVEVYKYSRLIFIFIA